MKARNYTKGSMSCPPSIPNIRLGEKPKIQQKTERKVAYFMELFPHYTNNKAPQPVRQTEIAEAKRLYPKARFFEIATLTTTTKRPI